MHMLNNLNDRMERIILLLVIRLLQRMNDNYAREYTEV